MAIDNEFGKGIGLAAGFDLGAQKPLDARIAVNTLAERNAHVDNNRAYEGMLVYVDEDQNTYQLIDGNWVVFFSKAANEESAEGQASKNTEQDNRLTALEQKVGKDIDGENPAEGLFAEVNEAKAAADAAQEAADNEASRAAEAEQALQGEIDAINNEENGILALAKKYADDQDAAQKALLDADIDVVEKAVLDEENRAKGEEAKLVERLVALEGVEGEDGKVEGGVLNEAKAYTDDREVEIRADIKEVTDGLDTRLQTAEGEIDQAQEDINDLLSFKAKVSAGEVEINLGDVDTRIKALEALHDGDNSVEKQIAAAQKAADDAQADVDALELVVGVEGKEAADGQEAVQATGLFKKIDDANAAIEEVMADDKAELEGKIAKEAEDREAADKAINDEIANMKNADLDGSLANLIADEAGRAAGEEARIEGLIGQEVSDREAADNAINDEIANMKNADLDGSLANLIADEAARAKEEEGNLAEAIENEAKRADAAEKVNAAAVVTEKNRAEAKEAELLAAIEAEVGKEGVQGNRDKAIADAIAVVNGNATALESRVKANEDAIGVINGNGEGSIKKAVADLVDGAPEATNTLNELAAAIKDNKDVYDGWVVQHEQAMDAMKAELQAEIDTDVKVVADELAKQKDANEEGSLANLIADEVTARENADTALEGRIAANETFVAAQPAVDQAQDAKILALENANKEGGAVANAIKAAQDAADAAQAAADAAQGDVDALEGRLDNEGGLVDRLEAVEDFKQNHSHEAINNAIDNHESRIAANEAFVKAQPTVDQAQNDRIKALEDANAEGGAMAEAVQSAQDAADAAQGAADAAAEAAQAADGKAVAAQNDVDALEAIVGKDAADGQEASGLVARIAANEAFVAAQPAIDEAQDDDIEDLQGRMSTVETFVNNHSDVERDKKIADNAAAIEILNGGADVEGSVAKSIADALVDYSTTEEMKSFVANVVSTLSLELNDNKVSLKLGEGVDGVTVADVSLDVATDDDINAIITGLDAAEEPQA